MNNELETKVGDIKKAEQIKRTELSMLYLLMEKYPLQVREKIRQPANEPKRKEKTASP